jgi:hypothetical protein
MNRALTPMCERLSRPPRVSDSSVRAPHTVESEHDRHAKTLLEAYGRPMKEKD